MISIIIPAYNEEASIEQVIQEILKLDLEKEIIVVDDGSRDKTAEIVALYSEVRLLKHAQNQGRGAAFKTALAFAKGDVICMQDADMEQDPKDIPRLVAPILSRESRVVYGSRFQNALGRSESNPLRLSGAKLFSFLAKVLFGQDLSDVYTGAKCYDKGVFDLFSLETNGFEQEVEILAKLSKEKIKIHEAPISYKYRSTGESKMSLRDGWRGIKTLGYYYIKICVI